MKSKTTILCLSELFINLAAGWIGIVIFGTIYKTDFFVILRNVINGIISFFIAVQLRNYEFL